MKQLKLQLPDDIHEILVRTAEQVGKTPEELALEWLAAAAWTVDDPLEEFIGAFRSNVPGWAEEHDKYIGQALAEQENTEKNNDTTTN